MEVIVERIEEDFLILELPDLKHVNIPRSLIPDALEGDVVDIKIDYEKRKKRENEIQILTDKLFIETNS